MVPTALVQHGAPFFGAFFVRRVLEVVVLALVDDITNAAFVACNGQFRVQKVCA